MIDLIYSIYININFLIIHLCTLESKFHVDRKFHLSLFTDGKSQEPGIAPHT